MAISKEKAILKISVNKKSLDLIETASKTWKITKSELIEQVVCSFIVAQVQKLERDVKDLENKVDKEKKNAKENQKAYESCVNAGIQSNETCYYYAHQ